MTSHLSTKLMATHCSSMILLYTYVKYISSDPVSSLLWMRSVWLTSVVTLVLAMLAACWCSVPAASVHTASENSALLHVPSPPPCPTNWLMPSVNCSSHRKPSLRCLLEMILITRTLRFDLLCLYSVCVGCVYMFVYMFVYQRYNLYVLLYQTTYCGSHVICVTSLLGWVEVEGGECVSLLQFSSRPGTPVRTSEHAE